MQRILATERADCSHLGHILDNAASSIEHVPDSLHSWLDGVWAYLGSIFPVDPRFKWRTPHALELAHTASGIVMPPSAGTAVPPPAGIAVPTVTTPLSFIRSALSSATAHDAGAARRVTDSSLFAAVRELYHDQYSAEMLLHRPLALCLEGLQAGENYLFEFP
ncbi:hypothetical protein T492DRAFT_76254 [Pavlovales sp. CCMP2436]|nr:hypothetical protein T492DRAFT_76254 [Pavlovales sp. CCMP2436]